MRRMAMWTIGALALLAAGALGRLAMRDGDDRNLPQRAAAAVNPAEQAQRGATLVRGGDCQFCRSQSLSGGAAGLAAGAANPY
ncbi:hypothetical protein [Collimonas sp.]|jgi:hypothetical protein|uniref:hypothetical protein n=1 Tax=Collimonas sp. TaxID=1963772 RepID=UPI0037BE392A